MPGPLNKTLPLSQLTMFECACADLENDEWNNGGKGPLIPNLVTEWTEQAPLCCEVVTVWDASCTS